MGKGDDPNCKAAGTAGATSMNIDPIDSSPLYRTLDKRDDYRLVETSNGFQVPIYGTTDKATIEQMARCLEHPSARAGAAMADNHLGYSQPVGGVVAYKDFISVSGVGYDIGCGLKVIRTNLRAEDVPVAAIMDEIVKQIPFGLGRKNSKRPDHPVLDKIRDAAFAPQRELLDNAAQNLGSVGSGNHFIDLLVEEGGEHDGQLCIAAHFGSRGFGHKTATGFLAMYYEDQRRKGLLSPEHRRKNAREKEGWSLEQFFFDKPQIGEKIDGPPVLLDTTQGMGQAYVEAMNLAGEYAFAGRDMVLDRVLDILGAQGTFEVHNNHNLAWKQNVAGEDCWVVRKGATPAAPGEMGFVGGSMGDVCVVVEGVQSDASEQALYSTVHGAGRQMSRAEAAGPQRKQWACKHPGCRQLLGRTHADHQPQEPQTCSKHPDAGAKKVLARMTGQAKINWDEVKADLAAKGVEVRGAAADEAPGAYKQLDSVIAAHEGQINVVTRMRPIGVAMAAPDEFDPFKGD